MNFIKSNDSEISLLKNKVTRDLQQQDRLNEQKQKVFKSQVDVEMTQLNSRVDTTIQELEHKSEEIDEKLDKIEPTAEVMRKVGIIVDEVDMRISTKVEENYANLDARIKKIYSDELTYKGKFGPDEDRYKSMRDFIVKGIDKTQEIQSKKIAIQRTDHNELFKSVAAINRTLEEDIHKQIRDLNDLTGTHVEELELLKNESVRNNLELNVKIDSLDVRLAKSEKLASDSDLFGLPGALHVLRIKID
jgi:hypothetical protein